MLKNLKIGRILVTMMTVVLVAPLFIGTTAQAQDFGQLLAAVEKVEANLKAMIAKESSARQKQIAQLQTQLDQVGQPPQGSSANDEQLVALISEIGVLRAELDQLRADQQVSSRQLVSDGGQDLVTEHPEEQGMRSMRTAMGCEPTMWPSW